VGPVALHGETVILTDDADPDLLSGTLVEGRLTFETENGGLCLTEGMHVVSRCSTGRPTYSERLIMYAIAALASNR
jgi:hypothetical protein